MSQVIAITIQFRLPWKISIVLAVILMTLNVLWGNLEVAFGGNTVGYLQ
jgi:hypothetical protein